MWTLSVFLLQILYPSCNFSDSCNFLFWGIKCDVQLSRIAPSFCRCTHVSQATKGRQNSLSTTAQQLFSSSDYLILFTLKS
jgi:hypothetical protein